MAQGAATGAQLDSGPDIHGALGSTVARTASELAARGTSGSWEEKEGGGWCGGEQRSRGRLVSRVFYRWPGVASLDRRCSGCPRPPHMLPLCSTSRPVPSKNDVQAQMLTLLTCLRSDIWFNHQVIYAQLAMFLVVTTEREGHAYDTLASLSDKEPKEFDGVIVVVLHLEFWIAITLFLMAIYNVGVALNRFTSLQEKSSES